MRLEDAENAGGLRRGRVAGRQRHALARRRACPARPRARSGKPRAGPCCCWAIRRSMASSAAAQASCRRPLAVSSPAMRKARCSSRSNTSQTQEIVVCLLDDLGGEIAAHAIGRRAFARHHRQPARLRLVVEIPHQGLELRRAAGRRSNSKATLAPRGWPADAIGWSVKVAGGERQRAERRRQQHRADTHTAARQARPPELHSIDTPVGRLLFLSPSACAKRNGQGGRSPAARRSALRSG